MIKSSGAQLWELFGNFAPEHLPSCSLKIEQLKTVSITEGNLQGKGWHVTSIW